MNNVYTKGPGDFEPEYTPEPNCEQVIIATREHPSMVMQNALDSFAMELKSAGIEWIKSGLKDDSALREVLNKSAADLLFRSEI